MADPITSNPALSELAFFVGDWEMTLSGASFLADPEQVIRGNFGCSWIEGGAVLVMRQGGPTPPRATWIIGRDEASPDYRVLYSDDRGVSRIYAMSLSDNKWRLWRPPRVLAALRGDGERGPELNRWPLGQIF